MNKRYKLAEVTRELAAVATGRTPADTVIRGAKLINVNTREVQQNIDVAISRGRIALVGDAAHTIGGHTEVIDAHGAYIAPGFIDGHIHIESSMMVPSEYARAVVPHGTTSIFADPHEIGNVFGTKGVQLMIDDAKRAPLRTFMVMPSCVPAVDEFEDNGEKIDADQVGEFIKMDEVAGLGEMMNFPGVLNGDESTHAKLKHTLDAGKIITGHYSIPETGPGLNAYIASGNRCCHETTRKEDAIAKLRLGMYVQVREGSAWHDLTEVIRCVTETNIDTRYVCLVSDDAHPHTLINSGHLDHIVRRAVEEGVDPITAIQMVTINAAQCFSMDQDIGSVSPGRFADIVFLDSLETLNVGKVMINGELVADGGVAAYEQQTFECPSWATGGMNLKAALTAKDFVIEAPAGAGVEVNTRVIEVIGAKVGTYNREFMMTVNGGEVDVDLNQDIIKVAVVERHHATGTIGKGFVKGFGIKCGAVASTVAHDAHNLMIVGTNDGDMAVAANELAKVGGGMIAVKDGQVIALLELPIAGLMTTEEVHTISEKVHELDLAWNKLGCHMVSPFMTMALIPLSVLPELRLTNRGLVDTVKFEFTELFPG